MLSVWRRITTRRREDHFINIPFLKTMKNAHDHFLFTSVDNYVRML